MIGQIVGNYKIEEKLGEGGMGAVYKGVDTMLDREVAIKALRPELASQTSVVERFRSEAVTLAKLNHPNIAALYSLFRQSEELYMVLEFVRGETLDNILQRRGALPADEAIPVFCQVLDGINHAHELGIVHRDIKPANIMLTENGKLKVLDFGIARLLGSARMTRAGNIIGTLEYMAPEQVKGQETDARSDIYALGMMLYEILTGRLAFDTENEFELMKLQTETMPPNPRQINPAIPEEVDAAIMRAIRKNPDERFQTAGEFMEMLLGAGFAAQGTMHGITGSYARPSTRPSRPPVSQAGISNPGVAATQAEKAEIKATRLGDAVTPPPSSGGIKETRLGASAISAGAVKATRLGDAHSFAAQETNAANGAANSFFSSLKPIHYAAAGVAALFLIGILVAIPLILLAGSSESVAEDTKTEEKKPDNSQRPEVITMPQTSSQPPATDINPPTDVKPVELETLTADKPSEKPADNPVASKPAEKPASVAQKPVAPPKKEAPKPAAKPKPAGKSRAEDLLTGN